jgi:hypothetical protein
MDSCLRWQHRTGGSGVTVLKYRNWTDDQEYICSVCRDAEPEPTEASVDIDTSYVNTMYVRVYVCVYIVYRIF